MQFVLINETILFKMGRMKDGSVNPLCFSLKHKDCSTHLTTVTLVEWDMLKTKTTFKVLF
jgi:hypothetical protein